MHSKLERKWWFVAIVSLLSTMTTLYVIEAAGIRSPYSLAQWVLYFCTFAGIWRACSFLGWLLVLAVAPRSALLGR